MRQVIGARSRGRTGTPHCWKAADFKSAVSTYFTIRAGLPLWLKKRRLRCLQ